MQQYCRTCGRTIRQEKCIKIFSRGGSELLHCVRTITNCWVENVSGFPCCICEECHKLLKKVQSFRKRCARIESYLNHHRTKIRIKTAAVQQYEPTDPLRIEKPATYLEQLEFLDIKKEPLDETGDQKQQEDKKYELAECDFNAEIDVDAYVPLNEKSQVLKEVAKATRTLVEHETKEIAQIAEENAQATREPVEETEDDGATISTSKQTTKKHEPKPHSSKRRMRIGGKIVHVKLTNDKQPKRFVDRDRHFKRPPPCICEHCGRQFQDRANLKVHVLRHTGTKNFECTECHEKCYTLHLLRRHQLKHTEGPYACTFCGEQYSTNSSRVRHEREACKKGRAPQSKTELIKRGERSFHCDVCDLWFLRAGNLALHVNSANHIENERRKRRKARLMQKVTNDTNILNV